jgi:DNA-binding transcriptional ArsR family regulator
MSDDLEKARPDYELDELIDADTAERMKALGDPIRLHIVDLVLERAMSVTELAGLVGRSRGTVAHHVDVLVAAGLVRVVATRRVRAIDERLYGRVARTIVFHDRGGELLPFADQAAREAEHGRQRYSDRGPSIPALFTFRHARIPAERAAEWHERLRALTVEFATEPSGGKRGPDPDSDHDHDHDIEYGLYVAMFPAGRGHRG